MVRGTAPRIETCEKVVSFLVRVVGFIRVLSFSPPVTSDDFAENYRLTKNDKLYLRHALVVATLELKNGQGCMLNEYLYNHSVNNLITCSV